MYILGIYKYVSTMMPETPNEKEAGMQIDR